jgi:hypothetical protein
MSLRRPHRSGLRSPRAARLALIAMLLLASTAPAPVLAQAWRTFEVSRAATALPAPLAVRVSFSAGRLTIRPDREGRLFDAALRYDADRATPRYAFDTAARRLELGVQYDESRRRWRSDGSSELTLSLDPTVDLDLAIEAGAAKGDIDLSGLRVAALTFAGGAAETQLRIDEPNALRPGTVRLDAGAASLEVLHLANLRAERVDVNVGVGRVLLDLTGDWAGDLTIEVSAALGAVELVVPSDIGVRVQAGSLLQSTDLPGLQRVGEVWESPGYAGAAHRVSVVSTGALGRLSLRRAAR